ncbi:MAG: hypothetical protein ACP5E9_10455 [Candidatus Methanospirareceae archaeon]
MFENICWMEIMIVLGGYIVLLLTSGVVVTGVLRSISKEQILKIGKDARDTGFVVGKCENILILTFMLLEGYTALALIFAAKAVVRREDMSKNSLFYLAGTMINVTYSITIGALMLVLLR